ncbi:MAG: hypothetical protein ACREO4_07645, partial [Lysobacter sp.]
ISRNTIALALVLAASSVACSAPDADSVTTPETPAVDGSDSAQEATGPAIDGTAPAPAAAPTGPVDPMAKQLVTMSAGLFAAERQCLPDRAASMDEARATNRKAMAGMAAGSMSEAQMDALFDSAYAEAEQKMEALSAAELKNACAELEAAPKAGAAAVSQ